MISTIIAISIAFYLQHSIHDTIMLTKGLPYLPNLITCGSRLENIYVEQFMVDDVKFIWNNMTYHSLQKVLQKNPYIDQFPLVDNAENMRLLGSIHRDELLKMIEEQIGRKQRLKRTPQWLESQTRRRGYGSCQESTTSLTTTPRIQKTKIKRDMNQAEKKLWRIQQLTKKVHFERNNKVIDPAPFQLARDTCLFQVHSLFVMIGIHTAYVTDVGELVGVVGLKEVRKFNLMKFIFI